MSTFMVHPQGCSSRGKDPLKKVPVWQGVGLEADTPRSSQEHWSLQGKNGGEHPCLQRGHMESVVRVWSLERWWMHKLSISRWVFKTKGEGYLNQWGPAGLVYEQVIFSPFCNERHSFRSGMSSNSGASINCSTFFSCTKAEAWEEESQVLVSVWLLSYCLIFSSSHHPLVFGFCSWRMKWGTRWSLPDLKFFESKTKPWR